MTRPSVVTAGIGPAPDIADYLFAGLPDPIGAYELDWRIWRAQRRDCYLAPAEMEAKLRALEEWMADHPACGPGLHPC